MTALLVCTAGSATTMRPPAPPRAPADGRAVASIARGRDRLWIVARDGTTWSVPEAGVTVGDEVRQLPQRERPENARALAESPLGLWVLGRDGRVRLQVNAGAEAPIKEVFHDLPPVVAMAAMDASIDSSPCDVPPDDTCLGHIDLDATTLALLDRDGVVHLRSASGRAAWQHDRVPIPAPVREIAVGASWGCAVDARGGAWCFMPDWRHGLALEAEYPPRAPLPGDGPVAERIAVPAPIARIAVSEDFACAETVSGRVWCWRHVFQRANVCDAHLPLTTDLREDTTPDANARRAAATARATDPAHRWPVVEGRPAWRMNALSTLSGDDTLLIRDGGADPFVEYGRVGACVLSARGALRCSGAWRADGHRRASLTPVTVSLPRRAVSLIDVAAQTRCALLDDGAVWCWGRPVGASVDVASGPPRRVGGLGAVRQIGQSGDHACALTREGSVWCWGVDERDDPPVELRERHEVDALTLDGPTILALHSHGRDEVFDAHDRTRRGPCPPDDRCVPPEAPGRDVVRRPFSATRGGIQVNEIGCGIRDDGRVACWRRDDANARTVVPGVDDARSISVILEDYRRDGVSACALVGDGRVLCWGDDRGGRLGDGRHTYDAWGTVRLPTR